MTRHLYVIGDPVSHSLSPTIHTLWLQAAGIDAVYSAERVEADELESCLDAFWTGDVLGLNVTLPHKAAALKASCDISPAAEAIGAANTLTRLHSGGWRADNTDAPGLLAALAQAGEDTLSGRRIAVIGAGGAARATVFALHKAGARLTILNRTLEKAESLSSEITGGAAATAGLERLSDVIATADIVINTASSGHAGQAFSLPAGSGRLFLDISYGEAAIPQLSAAAATGWRVEDGLSMLVAQAAESFHIWFGLRPDPLPALKICRTAVEARQ